MQSDRYLKFYINLKIIVLRVIALSGNGFSLVVKPCAEGIATTI